MYFTRTGGRPHVSGDDRRASSSLRRADRVLAPTPARTLFELAEPQRPVLEQAQDQSGPGAREEIHRVLEGLTVGVDLLLILPRIVAHMTFQGKLLDSRYLRAYYWYP